MYVTVIGLDGSSKCWASLPKTQYEAKRAKPLPGKKPPCSIPWNDSELQPKIRKHIRNTLQITSIIRSALYPVLNRNSAVPLPN